MQLFKASILTADVLHIRFFGRVGDTLGVISIGDNMGQTNDLPRTYSNVKRNQEGRAIEHLGTYE